MHMNILITLTLTNVTIYLVEKKKFNLQTHFKEHNMFVCSKHFLDPINYVSEHPTPLSSHSNTRLLLSYFPCPGGTW
jgi:hypothetical protein